MLEQLAAGLYLLSEKVLKIGEAIITYTEEKRGLGN